MATYEEFINRSQCRPENITTHDPSETPPFWSSNGTDAAILTKQNITDLLSGKVLNIGVMDEYDLLIKVDLESFKN